MEELYGLTTLYTRRLAGGVSGSQNPAGKPAAI
jgi:hypothetical protein